MTTTLGNRTTNTDSVIELPHARLEWLHREGQPPGLGRVEIDGISLRAATLPWRFWAEAVEGVRFDLHEIGEMEPFGEGVRVPLQLLGRAGDWMEYRDEYSQALIRLEPPSEPLRATAHLIVEPAELELDGRQFTGFSYRLEISSPEAAIHRVISHGTWEIAGSIGNNTLLHQGHTSPPVWHGQSEGHFSSACLKTVDLYGKAQGYSFQLGPRGGLLQIFDFQYDPQCGALLQYWPQMEAVSSLIESPPGSDLLHIVDEYRFEAEHTVTTADKHVLFLAGRLEEHEAGDVWHAAFQHATGAVQRRFGIKPTRVVPEVGANLMVGLHGETPVLELWGEKVPCRDALYAIADRVVPMLAASGVKRVFPGPIHTSDVTEWGMRRKLESHDALNSALVVDSYCATHRFLPAEFWGGMKAWRYLYDKATAAGIQWGHWFAPHYSPRSPLLLEHPEYLMRGPDTLPCSGGYGIHSISTVDWNTGIYQQTLDDLKRFKEEGGLDYIFTDSWPNLGLTPRNFSAKMRTNWEALGRLYAEIQELGIDALSFEGMSAFGISRFGIFDLRQEQMDAVGGIVGQNDLAWWWNHPEMTTNISMLALDRKRSDEELADFMFRVLAHGGSVSYEHRNHCTREPMPDWWGQLYRLWGRVENDMTKRRLLPAKQGVLWHGTGHDVLWSIGEPQMDFSPYSQIERVHADEPTERVDAKYFRPQPMTVYRLHCKS